MHCRLTAHGRGAAAALRGLFVLGCAALVAWPQHAEGRLAAPDPGGREHAIVKLPPPGPTYLGIHDLGLLDDEGHGVTPRQIAKYARKAGADMMRFTINWSHVERSPGVWDEEGWAQAQRAYDAVAGAGMRPFIGVAVAPPWARDFGLPWLCGLGRGCEYPPRPAMLGAWQRFVAEVARRFPKTAAIEIWNEPNLYSFWKPQPQPERYAQLVATAYDAIKNVNPRIEVVAGALAGQQLTDIDELGNVKMGMTEFLTRAYQANPSIAGHMDGLSFHQASQATRYGKNSRMALAFRAARTARDRYDTRKTPLWLSEFSLSTSENDQVTPAVQADGLLRAYRKVVTIPDVRGFLLHTLGDRVELPSNDVEYGVGMIAGFRPFTPKPSYCAFAGRASKKPPRPCRRIREGRVSRCSRQLVGLWQRVARASGKRKRALRTRHQRLTRRCVPAARRASRARGVKRPACLRKLSGLQRRYTKVLATLRFDVLVRHERVRRRCR